jgi:hypothetical protein
MLASTTDNPVYLISAKGSRGYGRSAVDAYSSIAPDPTFAIVVFPCCFTPDFVFFFRLLTIYSFTSRSIIGDATITGEGLQNLGLCSALRVFEQG